MHLLDIQKTAPPKHLKVADKHIRGDIQIRERSGLLHDNRDALLLRLQHIRRMILLSCPEHPAAHRRLYPGKN